MKMSLVTWISRMLRGDAWLDFVGAAAAHLGGVLTLMAVSRKRGSFAAVRTFWRGAAEVAGLWAKRQPSQILANSATQVIIGGLASVGVRRSVPATRRSL